MVQFTYAIIKYSYIYYVSSIISIGFIFLLKSKLTGNFILNWPGIPNQFSTYAHKTEHTSSNSMQMKLDIMYKNI